MKICKLCKKSKDLSEFYKDKNAKGGFRTVCKFCDVVKAKKWNVINKEKHCNHQKLYRENNRQATRDQRYKYAKTPKGKAKLKEWNDNNRDFLNNKNKEFRKRNPGYASFYATNRKKHVKRAKLKGFDDELKHIYLNCPDNKELHHIVPLLDHGETVSGLHVPWNLEAVTKEEHLKRHEELRSIYG